MATSLLLVSCGPGDGANNSTEEILVPGEPLVEIFRIGSISGGTFTEGVLISSNTALTAGEGTTIRANVVNQNGNPPTAGAEISFSSTCVSSALAVFDEPDSSISGLTTIYYVPQGCIGTDTIVATLLSTGETASIGFTIEAPEVLTVSFVGIVGTTPQLSLAGIGGNESIELGFRVRGPQGVPIIGDTINFSITTSVGGASILAGKETGITDNTGLVTTVLTSGTVPGPVSVLASHAATGIQGLSSDIIISTGIPVSSRFSLTYGDFNPANAFNTDGITVTLSIIASDQFGNNPTDGTRISFVAPESGNIDNSCELIDGACQVTWRSTSPRPADLRVELIAYTDGAEDYVDNNGNSVFDGSDGAISDLGEPYADENENGVYDLGEFFFDTNENGVRNTGNNLWDGPCLALADPSAICTGETSVTISDTVTVVMSTNTPRLYTTSGIFTPATITATYFPGSVETINMTQGTGVTISDLFLSDSNAVADIHGGNPLPAGTSIAFSVEGGGASLIGIETFIVPNTTAPTGPYGITVVAADVEPGDPLPAATRLLLTITTPGQINSQYSWPLNITF